MDAFYDFDSEDAVWLFLKAILADKNKKPNLDIYMSDLSWAVFDIKYRGEPYNQSLTTSAMRGLIDFQKSVYSAISILTKNSYKISILTDEELRAYELVFKNTSW